MTPQAQLLLRKIERDIQRDAERDKRNRMLFDRMRRGNWRAAMLGRISHHPFFYAIAASALLWTLIIAGAGRALSDELHVQCPTPGQPCKVLILSPQEEQLLMQTNGILDTAAQARALDLGQFSVYLKTRIAASPAGEVKPVAPPPQPAPPVIEPPKDATPN